MNYAFNQNQFDSPNRNYNYNRTYQSNKFQGQVVQAQ
jgi:hypothetical protein